MTHGDPHPKLRTITLEEHFATPDFLKGPGQYLQAYPPVVEQLCDLGAGRIAAMDAAGIDVQVLSLTAPGVEQLDASVAVEFARATNDHVAAALRRHPDRFAAFATLPTMEPDTAAAELERTVRTYGFKGALINGHTRGRYLDDAFFWPIPERAEALGVPLYLHPTPPPPTVVAAAYTGNYAPAVAFGLATAAWGWHLDTATHVLRLVLSKVFDRFPRLQVVIGHMGETLPWMLGRLERAFGHPTQAEVTQLERPIGAYFRENLNYTFSGFNELPLFRVLLEQVGVERILFSADYPFASMADARSFLDQLPVSPADKAQIAHGNAERLLQMNRIFPNADSLSHTRSSMGSPS